MLTVGGYVLCETFYSSISSTCLGVVALTCNSISCIQCEYFACLQNASDYVILACRLFQFTDCVPPPPTDCVPS